MLAALLLPTILTGAPPADAIRLSTPRVEFRADEASATRRPWIDANGWRMLRAPGQSYVYVVQGQSAALAAAEAFTYGARAFVAADAPGVNAFRSMLEFLMTIPEADVSPVADIAVGDDGSDASGEVLNLLTRMNLLYRIDRSLKPEGQNPTAIAHDIRSRIGDDKRSLRIFGSEVVVGRLLEGPRQGRVMLLNYSGRPIRGLRVRIRGQYRAGEMRASGVANTGLTDWTEDAQGTEFTIPELRVFAVIDLPRR